MMSSTQLRHTSGFLKDLADQSADMLAQEDPTLYGILHDEYLRQASVLSMVASSSVIHPSVLACEAMISTNVTAEGYPGARFHAGCINIDRIEQLAIDRAKAAFRAEYANVQPLSASAANLAVICSLLKPGDTLLGMALGSGGHLTHGSKPSLTGQFFNAVGYGVNESCRIDFDEVRALARQHRPKLIICGATAHPRIVDWGRFREIADEVGAYLLADITHIAGLVAAGEHPSPVDVAHVTTMQLIVRVREAFHVDLPLPALFETPTIAALAETIEGLIRAGRSDAAPVIKPVPRDERLPLSFAQQRLWFLDQLDPHSSTYNRSFAVRLTGPLNPESLEQSLREVIRRHEVLRTTYPTVDGEAHQIIAPVSGFTVRVLDLRQLPPHARDEVARRLVADEARRPFDLAGGPLVRASLLRLDAALHVLILSQHHINTDAWSNDVFAREVSTGYGAFSNGLPSTLADLSIQYADFATWQREWLERETLDRQLSFWKEELKGVPPSLELPTDRPRLAVQTFRGATKTFGLSKRLLESLKALSQDQGATLFMRPSSSWRARLLPHCGRSSHTASPLRRAVIRPLTSLSRS